MESLQAFTERIHGFQWDSVPNEPHFGLAPSLAEKVTPGTGTLRPFWGDTVAYFLNEAGAGVVAAPMQRVYEEFSSSLAAPLPLSSAHVTLHDLHAATSLAAVEQQMLASRAHTLELVEQARALGNIRTECTTVFNMMNTSIVIGLRAQNEDEHAKLMRARALFDQIVPGPAFTPHITVAYYRPQAPASVSPDNLRRLLAQLTHEIEGQPVELEAQRLYALGFDAMDNYWPLAND